MIFDALAVELVMNTRREVDNLNRIRIRKALNKCLGFILIHYRLIVVINFITSAKL